MTILTHFYNEEYLLPWWLMHHTQIFDHGILLNKGSTDRSVAICKQLAPHWEIRESAYGSVFGAIETDQEIMSLEQEVDGWKIALTVTEFLCMANRQQFYKSLHDLGHRAYFFNGFLMVDHADFKYPDPVYHLPLVAQRWHGTDWLHTRIIHNYDHGHYSAGRHSTTHPFIFYPSTACILKFLFSPWNEFFLKRKLQIAKTQTNYDIETRLGAQHQWTREKMEQEYVRYTNHTIDLRMNKEYQDVFPQYKP